MLRQTSFVLDSYALIGYLENEPFSNQVEAILRAARQGKSRLYLHVINLGEVYYITLREQGQRPADLAYSRIKAFPVELIKDIDEQLLLAACRIKAGHSISYADSFAAALAIIKRSPLLTGDPEFKTLDKQGTIAVEWLI